MRITYVARSFLDYRIPVLAELDRLCGGQLYFVTSERWSPDRVLNRLRGILGARAVVLSGERFLGRNAPEQANTSICVPYQPGLARAIRHTRPDVVVGDGFFKWTVAGLWQRLRHGTPLVVCYERWAHTERHAQWFRRLYRKLALRFTDAISCNGRLSRDYVVALGFPPERITLGHMAADTAGMERAAKSVAQNEIARLRADWLASHSQLPAPGSTLVFLYVGRLTRSKGLRELLEGWTIFAPGAERAAHRAVLVLVGDGPERESLEREARRKRLNVRFVGAVNYDDLPAYYAAADAFVIPTLEDNWSLVVPEAMACGLPILCSKYNGCWPELVQEGCNGWVFDPLDAQDVARCLREAVSAGRQAQSAERLSLRALGEQSREILKDHTPCRAAEAIYRACEMAIGQRANR